jgi:primary-amine oxidase
MHREAGLPHPLDPLTADEIRRAAGVLRREKDVDARWRFASIELKEPTKGELATGEAIPRQAVVVLWNHEDGLAYKALVSLSEDAVVAWEARPGEQPNITEDEFFEAGETLRRDPRVAKALAARGITDLEAVLFDIWAYGGSLVAEHHRGWRVGWVDVWYRDAPDSNP